MFFLCLPQLHREETHSAQKAAANEHSSILLQDGSLSFLSSPTSVRGLARLKGSNIGRKANRGRRQGGGAAQCWESGKPLRSA